MADLFKQLALSSITPSSTNPRKRTDFEYTVFVLDDQGRDVDAETYFERVNAKEQDQTEGQV